ncbi:hypothetical protein PR003_g2486 [Phytophthora rubi]|uniref:Uncharacterized protein n=1 Tax=Phytophthora rubi TaxID=129364 RepID=A0A6A4G108_9STRA|nr:hypothetical protein PR001_g1451 [Phytophthora rubi]KAE9356136.1 hypothetical protein PR003_g2486 [Phytophthora rubi]
MEPGTADLPELDPFFMKVQFIVNLEMLVAHPCAKLVESKCPGYGKFALLEEQIAAKNEATSLEDSFAWCGGHNDHGALTGLVQTMLTDSTGATVPYPDAQAGLLGTHLQPHICGDEVR